MGRFWQGIAPLVVAFGCLAQPVPAARVSIEGGTFRMGTPATSVPELRERYGISFAGAFDNECPQHEVTLGPFRIDRHEVTNERFAAFLADRPEWSPSRVPADLHNGRYLDHWTDGSYPATLADHPVVFVTWHAAQAFCRWAGGRLPTEAEWEFAARAGDEREFPWGDEPPDPTRANYSASGVDTTTPVGAYPPSPLGLHDLAGNVWEWILDEWQPAYAERARTDPVAGGVVPDAELSAVRGRRVVRGASFGGSVVNLRTRWRDSHVVTNAVGFVGFRCAYRGGGARTPPESGRAPVNGIEMYYELHGGDDGVPLVLLHGGGSTIDVTFGRVMPFLAESRRIIAVEEQGHGRTTDRDGPVTFASSADDVAALLAYLEVERADILGFSNGANVALEVALRHPRRVRKLVFASSMTRRDGAHPDLWEFIERASFSDMPQPLKDGFLRVNPDVRKLEAMHDKDAARMRSFADVPNERLRSIRAPTLIVLGDRDIVKPEHALELTRLIPDARLLILPGGHGDYLGEAVASHGDTRYPELTAGLILEFLDGR